MKTKISPDQIRSNAPAPTNMLKPMGIVLAYEHEDAARIARRRVLGMINKSIPELDCHSDEWSFQDLVNARCGQEAIEIAADCDIFIVATMQSTNLSASFRMWFNEWLESRCPKEAALVSIAGSEDGATLDSPVQRYLHWLARSHGLTFFGSSFELPKVFPTRLDENRFRDCIARPERYGINE